MLALFEWISILLIPCLIVMIVSFGLLKKIDVYESFVEGGKEGLEMAFSLLPFLVGMFVAIRMFRISGAMEAFLFVISPIAHIFSIPEEVFPLFFMRVLSGTAALGMTSEFIREFGPDSYIGRLASVIQGSTDTTFYILTVYFGAVGIKKMGHALKIGLIADVLGFVMAILFVNLLFYS